MSTEEPTLFPLDPAPQRKFVYSLNGDTYEADFFADRQQALAAAVKRITENTAAGVETAVVYTAIANHAHDQDQYPSGDAVLEWMNGAGCQNGGGEFAEGYLSGVTESEAQELERDLHAALDRWFARHPRHSASWFLAEDVQRHEVRVGVTLDLLERLVPGRPYRRTDGTDVVYQRHVGDWVQTSAGPELVTSFLAALDGAQFEEESL